MQNKIAKRIKKKYFVTTWANWQIDKRWQSWWTFCLYRWRVCL